MFFAASVFIRGVLAPTPVVSLFSRRSPFFFLCSTQEQAAVHPPSNPLLTHVPLSPCTVAAVNPSLPPRGGDSNHRSSSRAEGGCMHATRRQGMHPRQERTAAHKHAHSVRTMGTVECAVIPFVPAADWCDSSSVSESHRLHSVAPTCSSSPHRTPTPHTNTIHVAPAEEGTMGAAQRCAGRGSARASRPLLPWHPSFSLLLFAACLLLLLVVPVHSRGGSREDTHSQDTSASSSPSAAAAAAAFVGPTGVRARLQQRGVGVGSDGPLQAQHHRPPELAGSPPSSSPLSSVLSKFLQRDTLVIDDDIEDTALANEDGTDAFDTSQPCQSADYEGGLQQCKRGMLRSQCPA